MNQKLYQRIWKLDENSPQWFLKHIINQYFLQFFFSEWAIFTIRARNSQIETYNDEGNNKEKNSTDFLTIIFFNNAFKVSLTCASLDVIIIRFFSKYPRSHFFIKIPNQILNQRSTLINKKYSNFMGKNWASHAII